MRYLTLKKSTLVKIAIAFCTAVAVLAIAITVPAVETVSGKTKKLPIYCTQKDEKTASLSFDAAWGNEDTQKLIDILARYNVKATFFVVGEWVDKYPESVKALSDAGHEIMNHSNTHPHMPQLSRDDMIKELSSCNDKIEKITGTRPVLFRAPYGDYDNTMLDTVTSLGMYTIQWDVDSLDWKDYSADAITQRVTTRVKEGSIVLFHNAAKNTPQALPQIIEKLQADGYNLVPISKLIYKDNYTINHEGRQIPQTETKTDIN